MRFSQPFIDGQRLVSVPFIWRDRSGHSPPTKPTLLRVVGTGEQLRKRIGGQQGSSVSEALFRLELERVIYGIAGVLVQAINRRTVLGIREEGLRNSGLTSLHLFDPGRIGNGHAIQ